MAPNETLFNDNLFEDNPERQELRRRLTAFSPVVSAGQIEAARAREQEALAAMQTPPETSLSKVFAASLAASLPALFGGMTNGMEGAGHGGQGAAQAMQNSQTQWENDNQRKATADNLAYQIASRDAEKLQDTAADEKRFNESNITQMYMSGASDREQRMQKAKDQVFQKELQEDSQAHATGLKDRELAAEKASDTYKAAKKDQLKKMGASDEVINAVDDIHDRGELEDYAKGALDFAGEERRGLDLKIRKAREAARQTAPGAIHRDVLSNPDSLSVFSTAQQAEIRKANVNVPEIAVLTQQLLDTYDPKKNGGVSDRVFINPVTVDARGLSEKDAAAAKLVAQKRTQYIERLITRVKNIEGMGAAFSGFEQSLVRSMLGTTKTDLSGEGLIRYFQSTAQRHDPRAGLSAFLDQTARGYVYTLRANNGDMDLDYWRTEPNSREFLDVFANKTPSGRQYVTSLLETEKKTRGISGSARTK